MKQASNAVTVRIQQRKTVVSGGKKSIRNRKFFFVALLNNFFFFLEKVDNERKLFLLVWKRQHSCYAEKSPKPLFDFWMYTNINWEQFWIGQNQINCSQWMFGGVNEPWNSHYCRFLLILVRLRTFVSALKLIWKI